MEWTVASFTWRLGLGFDRSRVPPTLRWNQGDKEIDVDLAITTAGTARLE